MTQLRRLGDIETIGGGFYLPTPTRIVFWGDWGIVLSGLPIQELSRIDGLRPTMPGIARVIRTLPSSCRLPLCPPIAWLRTPSSTVTWADATIRATRFHDPYGWEHLDLFNTHKKLGAFGWSKITNSHQQIPGTYLARNSQGKGPRTYYLLRVGRNDIDALGELQIRGSDIRRLQLALMAMAGEPFRYSISSGAGDKIALRVPFLPDQERFLLECIGTLQMDPREHWEIAWIPAYTRGAVTEVLHALSLTESGARS